ncbi:YncE family protein [Luteimonas kalidii]|uniref:YncE family protein n=1 Tax=Luteimonas kalidii TaxID=3042025 RepID=A0ABT6JW91_9GAMM|nr:YncE family protein [Luteimonas kalidii]MDH5834732.1 YncE family protein [Luteimonas kalidii]
MTRFAPVLSGLVLMLSCAAASAQGTLLVGNKSDDSVWRLSLEDGRRLGEMPTGAGPHEIAVSADGRHAVVTDYGQQQPGRSLTVLALQAGTGPRSIDLGEHGRPHGIRLLPDGDALVTTEHSHALLRVDLDAGRVEQAIDVGDGVGHMVALSRDGAVAYVSKIASGTVSRIDLAQGRKTGEVPAGKGAEGIEVAADGRLWVTNRDDDTVTVHDPDTLATLATLSSPGFPIRVVFTPDGRHALVTNARAGTLGVFDAASHRQVATVALRPEGAESGQSMLGQGPMPIGVIADPARPRVYVAISGADRIAVVDATDWRVLDYWTTGRQPDALGIVPE